MNRSFAIGEALSRLQNWQLVDLADFHRDHGTVVAGRIDADANSDLRTTANLKANTVRTLGDLGVGWDLDVKGSITVGGKIAAQRVTGNTLTAVPARSDIGEEVYRIAQQQNQLRLSTTVS